MASWGRVERSTLTGAMGMCRYTFVSQRCRIFQQEQRYLSTSLPREKRKPVYLTPKNWKTHFESTETPNFSKKIQTKVRRDTLEDFLTKPAIKFRDPVGRGPHWLGETVRITESIHFCYNKSVLNINRSLFLLILRSNHRYQYPIKQKILFSINSKILSVPNLVLIAHRYQKTSC